MKTTVTTCAAIRTRVTRCRFSQIFHSSPFFLSETILSTHSTRRTLELTFRDAPRPESWWFSLIQHFFNQLTLTYWVHGQISTNLQLVRPEMTLISLSLEHSSPKASGLWIQVYQIILALIASYKIAEFQQGNCLDPPSTDLGPFYPNVPQFRKL